MSVQKLDGIQSSRLKVVYNAIPNSFASLLQSGELPGNQGGPVLLSVCSMVRGNEFKGVDTVIRALPKILKALPDLRYAVVGDGEIRPKLETLAAEVGVTQNVTFLGEVSDAELAELYRRCDLFVLPSRGQERQGVIGGEGFGRVYVEAALAAKPVVGSLSGGASEAVLHGKTGLLVNPDSTDDVANAVLTILQDPQLAARMGSAGRGWALDTFSEAALSRSLQELLRPYGIASQSLPKLVHAGGQP